MEEVIRGQQLVAKCLAREDKHCLTGPIPETVRAMTQDDGSFTMVSSLSSISSQKSREARAVSSSSSSSFEVEQSSLGRIPSDITCNHCKHDCSESLVSTCELTSLRGRVHGVRDVITMMVMMTAKGSGEDWNGALPLIFSTVPSRDTRKGSS